MTNEPGFKIAVVSASLGNGNVQAPAYVKQNIPTSFFFFNDVNFPPRTKAMTPKLQSKIVKFFAWQLIPNFDYYLWSENALANSNIAKKFLDTRKDFVAKSDQLFMYKNTQEIQQMLTECWYLISRFGIDDEVAIKKSLVKFKI